MEMCVAVRDDDAWWWKARRCRNWRARRVGVCAPRHASVVALQKDAGGAFAGCSLVLCDPGVVVDRQTPSRPD